MEHTRYTRKSHRTRSLRCNGTVFACIFYFGLIQHVPFHKSTVNNTGPVDKMGQGCQVVTQNQSIKCRLLNTIVCPGNQCFASQIVFLTMWQMQINPGINSSWWKNHSLGNEGHNAQKTEGLIINQFTWEVDWLFLGHRGLYVIVLMSRSV